MADIEEYLNNFLKIHENDGKKLGIDEKNPIVKRSNETYKVEDDDFIIKKDVKEMLQYATFYWLRLASLKPHVKENAEMMWGVHIPYAENILDIRPN